MDNQKIELKYFEKFIERFSFNPDVDLEYFYNGFVSDKPYIEKLRLRIILLSKSQNQCKKVFANKKVLTSKNKNKSKEIINEFEFNYLKAVETLKDTHHFLTSLLKLKYLIEKYDNPSLVLKNYPKMPSNFSEIIQNMKFPKAEWTALNNFNRMRNIVIHAPSEIAVEYLTSTVLDEFLTNILEVSLIMYSILNEHTTEIINVLKLREEINNKDELRGVETLGVFSAKYGLTANEVLEIIKNTDHDFVAAICIDMPIDKFDKEVIIDEVKRKSKEKERAKQLEIIAAKEKVFNQEQKVLIIDMEHATELHNSNYDIIVNSVYDLHMFTKPIKTLLLISDANTIQTSIAKEISFLIKSKEHIVIDRGDILKQVNSFSDNKLAFYCNEELFPVLNEIENEKYILIHKNKNVKISYPLKSANKLVFHNKSIKELSEISN